MSYNRSTVTMSTYAVSELLPLVYEFDHVTLTTDHASFWVFITLRLALSLPICVPNLKCVASPLPKSGLGDPELKRSRDLQRPFGCRLSVVDA